MRHTRNEQRARANAALIALLVVMAVLVPVTFAWGGEGAFGPLTYKAQAGEAEIDYYEVVSDEFDQLRGSGDELSVNWYVASGHVVCDHDISVSGNVSLLLCDDAELRMQSASIVVEPNATLNVFTQPGCSGVLVGSGAEHVIEVRGNAALNLYEGSFLGSDGTDVVYCGGEDGPVENAQVSQYGGTISFGRNGVYLAGGSFTMHDGCITDNANAGVCATNGARCRVNEGVIYDNPGYGLLGQGAESLDIRGGCVGYNKFGVASEGADDREEAGELRLEGGPVLVGNTDGDVVLGEGQLAQTGELDARARIGVKVEGKPGRITQGFADANARLDPSAIFASNDGCTVARDEDGEVCLEGAGSETGGLEVVDEAPKPEGDADGDVAGAAMTDAEDDASLEVISGQKPSDATTPDGATTAKGDGLSDVKDAGTGADSTRRLAQTKPEFVGSRIDYASEIGFIVRVRLPKVEGVDWRESTMDFDVSGANGRTLSCSYEDADVSQVAGSAQIVSFTCPLSSVELADDVKATLRYVQNGRPRTVSRTMTWEDAYGNGSNAGGAQASRLASALCDYGFYTQRFLASRRGWSLGGAHGAMEYCVRTPDQMNIDEARDALAQLNMQKSLEGCAVSSATMRLRLGPTFAVDILLNVPSGTAVDAHASFDGQIVEAQRVNDELYRLRIEDVEPQQLAKTISVGGEAGGYFYLDVSPLYYAKHVLETRPFGVRGDVPMVALYNYHRAALECFGS